MLDVKHLISNETELEQQLKVMDNFLKHAPKGYLSCGKSGRKVRYFRKEFNPKTKETKVIGLRRSEIKIVNDLALKNYYSKLIPLIKKEVSLSKQLSNFLKKQGKERVYSEMHEYRKDIIDPLYALSDDNAKKWLRFEFTPKEMSEESKVIQTYNGEWVRSKSEKIIADEFSRRGIPYRYECPLHLDGAMYPIHPDFTVFNKRTGKEYYLEHLGRIDDEDYFSSMLSRLKLYAQNQIFIGDKLLITYEYGRYAMDMNQLNHIIEAYLT